MPAGALRPARRFVERVAADHFDRVAFVVAARTRGAHLGVVGTGAAERRHLRFVVFLMMRLDGFDMAVRALRFVGVMRRLLGVFCARRLVLGFVLGRF